MKSLLFTYGTLKRGYGNNRLLQQARFVGEAISKSAMYRMYSSGFPILVDDQLGARVRGEVYEVDRATLHHCDALEGHPRWYCRRKRRFVLNDGTTVKAWVYVMPEELAKHKNVWTQGGALDWQRPEFRRSLP